MAATKYQVLYRYTNPNSNQFLTNDSVSEYDKVFELYHNKHKIEVGTEEEKLDASNEKSDLIIDGNSTANDNYNMLFKFTGTKRINKKVWMPKSIGYVIRDKNAIRDLITRAVDGDYSGQYLLMEGDTIENGVIVSKKNPIIKTISVSQEDAENKTYFKDNEELMEALKNKTIAQLVSEDPDDFGQISKYTPYNNNREGGVYNINIKIGYDFKLRDITYVSGSYGRTSTVSRALTDTEYSSIISSGGKGFTTVTATSSQVQTYEIPAHYEEVAESPYAICDTYERIEQSPWFVLSTHASLNSALEKAKGAVKSVGLDNVKVIKVVPTEQFIKIN